MCNKTYHYKVRFISKKKINRDTTLIVVYMVGICKMSDKGLIHAIKN